ncbi:hypothetical protein, partial [Oceanidesulfovibrio indonesiensis]|uniref:hypothetical protein n=1 Tax=Oceanidesulfovibrio indonesiensis TaxID=54767 RepID=UPI001ABF6F43
FKTNLIRAMGLRLWDLKKEYPKNTLSDCLQMIWDEFPELTDMPLYETKESNFERYRRRTNACIEARNILTFEET